MITCPHCNHEMRNIHEYLKDDVEIVVWYCFRCDFTLLLKKETVSITWKEMPDGPVGILRAGELTEDKRRDLKTKIEAGYRGLSNSHKIEILKEGIK